MAIDKVVDSIQLNSDLTSVANAIRTKGGTSEQLAFPSGFVDAIDAIETGGGGRPTKILNNILPSQIALVTGYLSGPTSFANPGTAKEVTTDYFDVSSFVGQNVQIFSMVGGKQVPWVILFFYKSDYSANGGRANPIPASFTVGNPEEFDGVSTTTISSSFTVPAGSAYARLSFRTGGNAKLVLTQQSQDIADYWAKSADIVLVDAIETDGTAT